MSNDVADLRPEELAFRSLAPAVQREVEQAGEWLIDRIAKFGPVLGYDLSDWDLWILRRGPGDFSRAVAQEANGSLIRERELDRQYLDQLRATMNVSVTIARQAMVYEKKQRVETIRVRPGLRIPVAWEDRYQLIYETELPWTISAVMQNAFLGNPLVGERRPWTSR